MSRPKPIIEEPSNLTPGTATRTGGWVQRTRLIIRFQEALAAYRRAIEVEPADYRNHQQLGAFYEHQSDYGEAAKAFRKAVELAPDEPELHRVLGGAYKSMGRFSEA